MVAERNRWPICAACNFLHQRGVTGNMCFINAVGSCVEALAHSAYRSGVRAGEDAYRRTHLQVCWCAAIYDLMSCAKIADGELNRQPVVNWSSGLSLQAVMVTVLTGISEELRSSTASPGRTQQGNRLLIQLQTGHQNSTCCDVRLAGSRRPPSNSRSTNRHHRIAEVLCRTGTFPMPRRFR